MSGFSAQGKLSHELIRQIDGVGFTGEHEDRYKNTRIPTQLSETLYEEQPEEVGVVFRTQWSGRTDKSRPRRTDCIRNFTDGSDTRHCSFHNDQKSSMNPMRGAAQISQYTVSISPEEKALVRTSTMGSGRLANLPSSGVPFPRHMALRGLPLPNICCPELIFM